MQELDLDALVTLEVHAAGRSPRALFCGGFRWAQAPVGLAAWALIVGAEICQILQHLGHPFRRLRVGAAPVLVAPQV